MRRLQPYTAGGTCTEIEQDGETGQQWPVCKAVASLQGSVVSYQLPLCGRHWVTPLLTFSSFRVLMDQGLNMPDDSCWTS